MVKINKLVAIISLVYIVLISSLIIAGISPISPNTHFPQEIGDLKNFTKNVGIFLKSEATTSFSNNIQVGDLTIAGGTVNYNVNVIVTNSANLVKTNITCCKSTAPYLCISNYTENKNVTTLFCNQYNPKTLTISTYIYSTGIELLFTRDIIFKTGLKDKAFSKVCYWGETCS